MTKRSKQTLAQPAPDAAPAAPAQAKGKLGVIIDLLTRPQGARLDELVEATGWQPHSVRGALSGALKRERGLAVSSAKTEAGRVYRLAAPAQA